MSPKAANCENAAGGPFDQAQAMFFQHSHWSTSDPPGGLPFPIDLRQAIASVVYGILVMIHLMNPETNEKKKIKFAKKNTEWLKTSIILEGVDAWRMPTLEQYQKM